jgi:hypothetical protein
LIQGTKEELEKQINKAVHIVNRARAAVSKTEKVVQELMADESATPPRTARTLKLSVTLSLKKEEQRFAEEAEKLLQDTEKKLHSLLIAGRKAQLEREKIELNAAFEKVHDDIDVYLKPLFSKMEKDDETCLSTAQHFYDYATTRLGLSQFFIEKKEKERIEKQQADEKKRKREQEQSLEKERIEKQQADEKKRKREQEQSLLNPSPSVREIVDSAVDSKLEKMVDDESKNASAPASAGDNKKKTQTKANGASQPKKKEKKTVKPKQEEKKTETKQDKEEKKTAKKKPTNKAKKKSKSQKQDKNKKQSQKAKGKKGRKHWKAKETSN